jgi:4-amino-4-deoxy-L-arabinose transferase-like glycosyltransferase
VLLLAALSYGLYFHATGRRHLWPPDEDEYIVVNREMVEDGHWLYPTVHGKPYSIKPPLFNWLGSGFSVLAGGVTEWTSRLPSALAATVGLFLLWWLGGRLFGGRSGLLAALVLATSPLYVEFARWIQIGMLSTVLNAAALGLFWWGYSTPRRRAWAYVLMYVPAAVGVLNTGPISVVMPALVIGTFLLVTRDLRHLAALRLHWGLLVILAVAGPWFILVCRLPEYREGLLFVTNLERFFTTRLGHTQPFWYYLRVTPPYFLPWVLFLPSAVLALRTSEGEEDRKPLVFVMVWVAALLVFFSFSRTKRSEYVLPVYPALALLVGYVIDRGLSRGVHSGRWWGLLAWPARLMVVSVLLGGVGVAVWAGLSGDGWLALALPVTAFLVVGGVVAAWSFRRGRGVVAIGVIAVAGALTVAWSMSAMIERFNAEKSAVAFCENVADRFPEGSTVRQFRIGSHAFAYHLRRPLRRCGKPRVLREWLEVPERIHVIVKEREFERVRDRLPESTHVVHRERINRRQILLVSNRPD